MGNLAEAINIASAEFVDVTDKSGQPYILHCLWVMDKVRHLGEKYMIVGVLHDLLEDTNWTKEMLAKEGFLSEVVVAIDVMTHKPEDSYEEYVKKIGENEIATQVKLIDLEHNSKITRLKGLRQKDIDRLHKYHKSYLYLKGK